MAAMAMAQGAEPRGLGARGAAHAPWLLLLRPQTALTWSRSRGCPGHCPPPAGPAGMDPRAEAWYMSGCCHQFGSPHSKRLWKLPRGPWHLQAQSLPETTSSPCRQPCLWRRCWDLLAPRWCRGNGTGYLLISFSNQLTYWYTVKTSLSSPMICLA